MRLARLLALVRAGRARGVRLPGGCGRRPASRRSARDERAAASPALRTRRTSGEAAELAAGEAPALLVLEGSGVGRPAGPWDAAVLVAPASVPVEYRAGLSRALPALAVRPGGCYYGNRPTCWARTSLRASLPHPPLPRRSAADRDRLHPVPLADVRGERVFFTTTAPPTVAERQIAHLEADPRMHGRGVERPAGRPGRSRGGHGERAGIRRPPHGAEGRRRRRGVRAGPGTWGGGRVRGQPGDRGRGRPISTPRSAR